MAEKLVVHLDNERGAVLTYGPVIYVVWRAHALDPIGVADTAIAQLVKRYGEGRKLFYVHRAPDKKGSARTDAAVREATMKHFERQDSHFASAALAIEATGFGGSVIRSITAGVLLVRRTPLKTESFKDARDGVRWLGTQAAAVNPFDAADMVSRLEEQGFSLRGA